MRLSWVHNHICCPVKRVWVWFGGVGLHYHEVQYILLFSRFDSFSLSQSFLSQRLHFLICLSFRQVI